MRDEKEVFQRKDEFSGRMQALRERRRPSSGRGGTRDFEGEKRD